jgi:hypothetical protein
MIKKRWKKALDLVATQVVQISVMWSPSSTEL